MSPVKSLVKSPVNLPKDAHQPAGSSRKLCERNNTTVAQAKHYKFPPNLQALKTLQVDSLSGASKIRFFIAREQMGDLNFLPSSC